VHEPTVSRRDAASTIFNLPGGPVEVDAVHDGREVCDGRPGRGGVGSEVLGHEPGDA
jgi:hypothetical protein